MNQDPNAWASLFVGDLHLDVAEAQLFEKFSGAGSIRSIHVCRDFNTRKSLGYAYVNFKQRVDAERALDMMNFDLLENRPMRIMWSQRDPSLRKSGVGNVFIKNLNKSVDTKAIYDTFSGLGTILSCKVAQDESGNSKGFGFVHFEKAEAANKSIEKVNGLFLNGRKIYVGRFIPRKEREKELEEKPKLYTNVYIKNFGEDLSDDQLKKMFEKFGHIRSYKIMYKDDGKSKGFGFVAFEESAAAEAAVNELNGKEFVEGKPMYVGRAQKRAERQSELEHRFNRLKIEHRNYCQGVNLYIKNLDSTFDSDRLKKEFSKFGTITSVKLIMDEGRSKGFGFVCFSSPEEATKAVTELNGRIVGSKPLYVALAQRKDHRKALLSSQYTERLPKIQQLGSCIQPANMTTQPQRYLGATTSQMPAMRPLKGGTTSTYATENIRNPPQSIMQGVATVQQQAVHVPGQEPLTVTMLAEALPHVQKRMLGVRLFQLIYPMHPTLAGKITGMILEIDNSELLYMLEDCDLLKSKVEEALAVIQSMANNEI